MDYPANKWLPISRLKDSAFGLDADVCFYHKDGGLIDGVERLDSGDYHAFVENGYGEYDEKKFDLSGITHFMLAERYVHPKHIDPIEEANDNR